MVVFVFPRPPPCLSTKLSLFALQTIVHEGTSPTQGMGAAAGRVENIHSKSRQAAVAAAAVAAAAAAAALQSPGGGRLAGVVSVSREGWLRGAWSTHPGSAPILDFYLSVQQDTIPSPWQSPCWMGGGGQMRGWRRDGWASEWAGCVPSG